MVLRCTCAVPTEQPSGSCQPADTSAARWHGTLHCRLVEAFQEYDEFFALSRRQYVPPNFAEIRHILNIAQVGARHARLCYCIYTHTPPAWLAKSAQRKINSSINNILAKLCHI